MMALFAQFEGKSILVLEVGPEIILIVHLSIFSNVNVTKVRSVRFH